MLIMTFYKRKSNSLSEDCNIKNSAIKSALLVELSKAIKNLQQEHITSKDAICNGELTNTVCNVLEAIFLHGLKDSLTSRFSYILGSGEKITSLNFWSLVSSFSHKDVTLQINKLNLISSDVGKCRAWLRLSLNEGLTSSYIEAITKDKRALSYYYWPSAFLNDSEKPDIMKKYLQGLIDFSFQLICNSKSLNVWNEKTLLMAGILEHQEIPTVVMAVKSENKDNDDSPNKKEEKTSPSKSIINIYSEEDCVESKSESSTNFVHQFQENVHNNQISLNETLTQLEIPKQTLDNHTFLSKSFMETSSQSLWHHDANKNIEAAETAIITRNLSLDLKSVENMNYNNEEPAILPVNVSDLNSFGNSLGYGKGWSSPFEDDAEVGRFLENNADQSFNSLLQSYTPSGTTLNISGIEKILRESTMHIPRTSESTDEAEDPISDESDFEIISKRALFDADEEHVQELISIIGELCPENDLETQRYQCHGCAKPIGIMFGKVRKCYYDGYFYCYECHNNNEYYIPAFIIFRWEFKKHPVCKLNLKFLEQVEDLPLIDLRKMNPLLYKTCPELNDIQIYRSQLSSLRHYLFTCNQSIAGDFRRRLWPKEYLYENIHLYSLIDFLQVHSGHLAHKLKKIISFATKHVVNCRLCSQKGFICEICNNSQVIYPFEIDTTYKCNKCKAVYHKDCMNDSKPCPKCVRRLARQQQTGIDFYSPDSIDYGTCVQ